MYNIAAAQLIFRIVEITLSIVRWRVGLVPEHADDHSTISQKAICEKNEKKTSAFEFAVVFT